MDPSEREDSSTYINQPQSNAAPADHPTAPQTLPSVPYTQPVKKKSKAPLVLGLLLVLALVGCGVLAWMMNDVSNQKSSLQSKSDAKDEKIATLSSQLTSANNTIKSNSKSATTTDTTNNESEAIVKAALAYAGAYVSTKGTLAAAMDKQSGNFARVIMTTTAGSGAAPVYLKKVGITWVGIGNGSPDTTSLEQEFGLPKGF